MRKYKEKDDEEQKGPKINYNWDDIKRDKIFRIVYNDKIVSLIKKKLIKKIQAIAKEKMHSFKKNNPKSRKKAKIPIGLTYKQYIEKIEEEKEEINNSYKSVIDFLKNIKPLEFITEFLNKNIITNKRYLINTRLSKKININKKFLAKLLVDISKNIKKKKEEMTVDEEISDKIDTIFKKSQINSIKDYLPSNLDIEPFPLEQKKFRNNEMDISDSEETKITIQDSCNLLKDLNKNILSFRQKNKQVREKEKKN